MRSRLPPELSFIPFSPLRFCPKPVRTPRDLSTIDGLRFSVSAAEGLSGTIAFHSNRDRDVHISTMNADASRETQLATNDGIHEMWRSPLTAAAGFGAYSCVTTGAEGITVSAASTKGPSSDHYAG